MDKPICKCTSILVIYLSNSPYSVFSLFLREFFGESKEKIPRLHHHFPLSLFQPNTFQKVFSHLFIYLFFIISKIHFTKHTLKSCTQFSIKKNFLKWMGLIEPHMCVYTYIYIYTFVKIVFKLTCFAYLIKNIEHHDSRLDF